MKIFSRILLPALIIVSPLSAFADSWKDESGHRTHRGLDRHEYKQEYWDGHCKVERKLKKNGDYKEKRRCSGLQHGYGGPATVHFPAPSVIAIDPGITIHGTIRFPR